MKKKGNESSASDFHVGCSTADSKMKSKKNSCLGCLAFFTDHFPGSVAGYFT